MTRPRPLRGRFMVPMQGGSVLYVCTKFEADSFFVQKLLRVPNLAAPQTPFPGAWDGQNLISWRWLLPLPTDPVWWGSMHTISSYRGNRPTNTHKNTVANQQTGPITIHCADKLSVQCNETSCQTTLLYIHWYHKAYNSWSSCWMVRRSTLGRGVNLGEGVTVPPWIWCTVSFFTCFLKKINEGEFTYGEVSYTRGEELKERRPNSDEIGGCEWYGMVY